jgi:alpha-L-fucosidase
MTLKTASASPSQAQQQWMELGYGLFIHFGPNTFTASGSGGGKFPAADFHPAALDTAANELGLKV